MTRFSVVIDDITRSNATAIVDATDFFLSGMSGLDGAIHRAAGPALSAECRGILHCNTGAAKLTFGYNLRAYYIIHTVGPVWQGGMLGEARLLASCYSACLQLAAAYKMESVDFPPISIGLYQYPLPQAAFIAVSTIMNFLSTNEYPRSVRITCEDNDTLSAYRQAYQSWLISYQNEQVS